MAVTVLDSKDLVTALTRGETPVPKEVAEDRGEQAAEPAKQPESAELPASPKREDFQSETAYQKALYAHHEPQRAAFESDEAYDEAHEEWALKGVATEKMLRTVAKKTQRIKEAEEYAADQLRQRRFAESERDQLRREIEELRAQNAPKPQEPAKKPEAKDFKTVEEYTEALVSFRVAEQLEKERRARADQVAATEQASRVTEATARVERAKELSPEFAAVADEKLPGNLPGHIAAAMQLSEMLPELWLHFHQNPKDIERLAGMLPARAILELGRIESKLQPFASSQETKAQNGSKPSVEKTDVKSEPPTGSASKPEPRPRAPAPITPLSPASASQVEKAPQERTLKEDMAAWQKEHGTQLRRRKRN